MRKHFFVNCLGEQLYVMAWTCPSPKGNIFICPALRERSVSGIRYYLSQLASTLNFNNYNVFTFDYPGNGNSTGTLESLQLSDTVRSATAVIQYLRNYYNIYFDVIIGIGYGNYICAEISDLEGIAHIILINPRLSSVRVFWSSIHSIAHNQDRNILNGYFETEYFREVANGSDATFTIMNMETPNPELKFWDAICGPFFAGESESVGYTLIEQLALYNYEEYLSKCKHIAIFNWGKECQGDRSLEGNAEVFSLGEITNDGYWVQSSDLYDESIDKVKTYVCKVANKINHMTSMLLPCNNKIRKTYFVKPERVIVRGNELLGFLAGPEELNNNKPIIVFEHGLCCDSVGEFRAWVKLSEILAMHGFFTFRYDHAGAGVSGGAFEDSTYDSYLQDLLGVVDYLDSRGFSARKIVLVSWSFGACVSLMAANQIKDRICNFVFWSPILTEGTATSKVRIFHKKARFLFPISPLWLDVNFLRQEKELNFEKLFSDTDIPTLLITGSLDNETFYAIIDKVAFNCKNRKIKHIMIDNDGHCFSRKSIEGVINSTVAYLEEYYG